MPVNTPGLAEWRAQQWDFRDISPAEARARHRMASVDFSQGRITHGQMKRTLRKFAAYPRFLDALPPPPPVPATYISREMVGTDPRSEYRPRRQKPTVRSITHVRDIDLKMRGNYLIKKYGLQKTKSAVALSPAILRAALSGRGQIAGALAEIAASLFKEWLDSDEGQGDQEPGSGARVQVVQVRPGQTVRTSGSYVYFEGPGPAAIEGSATFSKEQVQGFYNLTHSIVGSSLTGLLNAHKVWPRFDPVITEQNGFWKDPFIIPAGAKDYKGIRTAATALTDPHRGQQPWKKTRGGKPWRKPWKSPPAEAFSINLPPKGPPYVKIGVSKGRTNGERKNRQYQLAFRILTEALDLGSEFTEYWEILREEMGVPEHFDERQAFMFMYEGGWNNGDWSEIARRFATNLILDKVYGAVNREKTRHLRDNLGQSTYTSPFW